MQQHRSCPIGGLLLIALCSCGLVWLTGCATPDPAALPSFDNVFPNPAISNSLAEALQPYPGRKILVIEATNRPPHATQHVDKIFSLLPLPARGTSEFASVQNHLRPVKIVDNFFSTGVTLGVESVQSEAKL